MYLNLLFLQKKDYMKILFYDNEKNLDIIKHVTQYYIQLIKKDSRM